MTMLERIPSTVLRQVRTRLSEIAAFNGEIERWRAPEARLGQAGRYEYEYRVACEPQVQQAHAWLARFAEAARRNGMDPAAVYTALGSTPAIAPWSAAARAWQEGKGYGRVPHQHSPPAHLLPSVARQRCLAAAGRQHPCRPLGHAAREDVHLPCLQDSTHTPQGP